MKLELEVITIILGHGCKRKPNIARTKQRSFWKLVVFNYERRYNYLFKYLNLRRLNPNYCKNIISDAQELRDALIIELPFDNKGDLIRDEIDTKYLKQFEKDVYNTARLQLKLYYFNAPSEKDWAFNW